MSSTINTTNIDTTYPIAGQDNDSQGFRDNFTNINTNFESTKSEIEDLQNNVVLKAPLTGGSVDNDFGGLLLHNAVIENFRGTVVNTGNVGATVQINVAAGPYHKIITQEPITAMTFTSWPPSGEHGVVQVEIFVSDLGHTVTLADTPPVWFGLKGIQTAVGQTITFLATGNHILEFASTDNGATVSVNQLTTDLSAVSTGLNDIVEDTSPQLGGDLDVLARIITTTSTDGNITLLPDGTGSVVLDGQNWPQADGTAGYILKTNGAGQLSWAAEAGAVEPATQYTTGAAVTLDTTAGSYFYPSGSGTAITFTFGNPAASGNITAFTMELVNGGTDAPSWPASVDWPAATQPSWTATGVDVVSFITRDGGTTWLGMLGGLDFS